ncbi:cytochrome C [Rhodoblastus sp.]|uniref:cytochrome C n=1 Tax=Rhodoblastus sp. TaxID=1962975 RepID=UPI0026054228|nr:cytochrome C [Rhodoblastus sp.]
MAGINEFNKALRAGAVFGLGLAGLVGASDDASALPSFARQTGQNCSTCHTAFPQLTPYGRRFKLGGYTAGGGIDTQFPPISFMLQSTYTNLDRGLNAPAGSTSQYVRPQPPGTNGFNDANNWVDLSTQASIFWGGKIWGNLGAFVQATYSLDYGSQFAWDNTDVRYAETRHIGPFDVVWGLDFNNNPTVQDPWNTTPAWGFPFIGSPFAPGPAASTMLEGADWGPGQVVGAGGYLFINDMLYLELTGYGGTSHDFQWAITGGPASNLLSGVAPYYRVALEKDWGEHSLEVGAYGMNANVITGGNSGLPAGTFGWPTDIVTDNGFDLQYQWITDVHAVTLRANYILERQQLTSSLLQGISANNVDYLRSLKIGAEYVYKNTYAFTATYFNINGTADMTLYSANSNFSPNSEGWMFDISYLPFSRGGPSVWPWANARIGLSYTLYTRFNGGTSNVDPTAVDAGGANLLCNGGSVTPYCRSASDNNTLLAYAWFMW